MQQQRRHHHHQHQQQQHRQHRLLLLHGRSAWRPAAHALRCNSDPPSRSDGRLPYGVVVHGYAPPPLTTTLYLRIDYSA
jgi:hypothetical protein